jgi:hypothetical protein
MLITPSEAERPRVAMRLRYVPPTVTLHRIETEGWIAGSVDKLQQIVVSDYSVTWAENVTYGDGEGNGTNGDAAGLDIFVPW